MENSCVRMMPYLDNLPEITFWFQSLLSQHQCLKERSLLEWARGFYSLLCLACPQGPSSLKRETRDLRVLSASAQPHGILQRSRCSICLRQRINEVAWLCDKDMYIFLVFPSKPDRVSKKNKKFSDFLFESLLAMPKASQCDHDFLSIFSQC